MELDKLKEGAEDVVSIVCKPLKAGVVAESYTEIVQIQLHVVVVNWDGCNCI